MYHRKDPRLEDERPLLVRGATAGDLCPCSHAESPTGSTPHSQPLH